MKLASYIELLAFASVSGVLAIPFKTTNSLDELYVKCSLLALEKLSYEGKYDFVYAIWDPVVEDIISSVATQASRVFIFSERSFLPVDTINYRMFPATYLLYATNFTSFQSIFSNFSAAQSSWFPRGVFFVLLQQYTRPSDCYNIANQLYSSNVYNFIILTSNENHTAVDVYKWDPFSETSRCGTAVNVNKINVCDGSKMLSSDNDLFSINFPPTFPRGCIMKAAAFHWPPYTYASPPETNNFVDGLSIRMMRALMRRYGLEVNYLLIDHRARWGVHSQTNNSWTGVIGSVQKGEADIALGQILQTPLRLKTFDYSYTGSLFMKFYLALPGQLPHWKSMIRIFPFYVWSIIFSVYIITCIVTWLLSRIPQNSENGFYKGCSNCFISLWPLALSAPTNTEPSSRTVRLVFLPWLVYSFHITLVYSSALLGVITTPINEKPTIKTLEQFSASKLRLLVVPQFVQVSMMMDEKFKWMIVGKRKGDLKITDAEEIEQMISKKDFAIVDPHEHFEIVAQEKLEYIYTLDDVVRLNQGQYLRRGSIFSKYVNNVQLLLSENGIYEKWRRDLVGGYKYKKHRKVSYRNEVLPLTAEELSGSFYVLLFGLSISFICFCFELCYVYFKIFVRKTIN